MHAVVQEIVGTVDVKTKNAHFYVQRNSSFSAQYPGAVIPFDVAPVNEGNAFDLPSGRFTVPVPGIYHFDFSAVKSGDKNFVYIYLQVNGVNVGLAYTAQSAEGSLDVVSLSSSLRLVPGDRVNLFNFDSKLYENENHRTHFSGWLVEEDLM